MTLAPAHLSSGVMRKCQGDGATDFFGAALAGALPRGNPHRKERFPNRFLPRLPQRCATADAFPRQCAEIPPSVRMNPPISARKVPPSARTASAMRGNWREWERLTKDSLFDHRARAVCSWRVRASC